MNKKGNALIDIGVVILIISLIALVTVAMVRIFWSQDKDAENKLRTMVKIDSQKSSYSSFDIFYDSETKVMYLINYHGGVTVMLNPDGTPRIYEGGGSK